MITLDNNVRYLQLAFNDDLRTARSILPRVVKDPRIMIEAGTPFIKREGMSGVNALARMWPGIVVADIKVSDGAIGEVDMDAQAGARAITALGLAPVETLRLFIERCAVRHHLDDRHAWGKTLKVRAIALTSLCYCIHRDGTRRATRLR